MTMPHNEIPFHNEVIGERVINAKRKCPLTEKPLTETTYWMHNCSDHGFHVDAYSPNHGGFRAWMRCDGRWTYAFQAEAFARKVAKDGRFVKVTSQFGYTVTTYNYVEKKDEYYPS